MRNTGRRGVGVLMEGAPAGRLVGAAAPVLLALVPKCPLCALPLLAAAGVGMPSGRLLDGMVAAAAILWLAFAVWRWRSAVLRAGAAVAVLLLVASRWSASSWGTTAACALMLAVALWRLRTRCPAPAACLGDLTRCPGRTAP